MYEKVYKSLDGDDVIVTVKYSDTGRLLEHTNLTIQGVKLLTQDEFPLEAKGNSNVYPELKLVSLKIS